MTRRDPYSWTVVRLPERDLADIVLELAAPLLERLGPAPAIDDARAALALAVTFWNASVLASKRWEYPRTKELNALKKRMRGRAASREDAATFELLTERWRQHWLDPRLVESWNYEPDAAGVPRLVCTMGLPEGVRAEVPPPAEKRVAIGGKFLDEVQISQGGNSSLSFPVDRHRGVVAEDGTATVYAMLPSALKLFAEGRLTRVGGDPVEVAIRPAFNSARRDLSRTSAHSQLLGSTARGTSPKQPYLNGEPLGLDAIDAFALGAGGGRRFARPGDRSQTSASCRLALPSCCG